MGGAIAAGLGRLGEVLWGNHCRYPGERLRNPKAQVFLSFPLSPTF